MSYDKLQTSFSGGIIEPGLWHRNDLAYVATGLKTSHNAIIGQNGNWKTRPGTHYLGRTYLDASDKQSGLFEFYYNGTKYLVEISENKLICRKYDLSELTYSTYNMMKLWIPFGHRNRPAYSAYEPHEFVRVGKSWTIQYTDGADNPYFHLYVDEQYGACSGLIISVGVNTTDDLSVTTPGDTLLIKFANTTASKNSPALIEEAIQESGVVTIDNEEVMGFSYAWINPSTTWTGDFSGYVSGLTVQPRDTNGLRRLNRLATDYLAPEYVPESVIEFTCDYTESDLENIKFHQVGNEIFFVDGTHRPKIFTFYSDTNYFFSDMEFETEPSGRIEPDAVLSGGFGSDWELRTAISDVSDLVGRRVRASAFIGQVDSSVEYENNHSSDPLPSSGIIFYDVTDATVTEADYGLLRIEYTLNGESWIDSGVKLTGGLSGYYDYGSPVHFRLNNVSGNTHTVNLKVDAHYHVGYGTITDSDSGFGDSWCIVTPETLFPYTADNRCDIEYSVWNDVDGWPKVVYSYQNRLGFAATTKYPITRWESKLNDFYNFNQPATMVATDPTNINLPTTKTEYIQNVITFVDMVILTDRGVWYVNPDQSGYGPLNQPITKQISSAGSSSVQAITANQTLIYVSQTNHSLMAMRYDVQSQNYISFPLSDRAAHLFKDLTITKIVYQGEPAGIVWLLMSDGSVISMTFSDTNGIAAFCTHNFGDVVEWLMAYTADYEKLFLIVNRNGKRCIEYMDLRRWDTIEDVFSVDSGLSFSAAPATQFTGFAHIDGEPVAVLADKWKITGRVIASNKLTLTTAASNVVCGLPFTSNFEPLRPILDRKSGSGIGLKQSQPTIKVLYKNTLGGKCGYSSSDLYDIPSESDDPTLPAELIELDCVTHALRNKAEGKNDLMNSQFYYRQTSPYPAEILAIIPNVSTGG